MLQRYWNRSGVVQFQIKQTMPTAWTPVRNRAVRQFPAHGLFNHSLTKNLKLSVGPLILEKSGWFITGHHPYWESLYYSETLKNCNCSLPVSGPLLVHESMSIIHKSCNSVFITWAVTGEALQKLSPRAHASVTKHFG